MPLNDMQKRQVCQFALIADGYLQLGSPAASLNSETFGMTKAAFLPSSSVTSDTRWFAMVSAHLSSAAIRLASIDEVLRWAGFCRPIYGECRDYFGWHPSSSGADPRGESCSEWLHVMLRDNASHEEPSDSSADVRQQRRRKRQDCIESLTFAAVYAKLRQIAEDIVGHLRTAHSLEVPRI